MQHLTPTEQKIIEAFRAAQNKNASIAVCGNHQSASSWIVLFTDSPGFVDTPIALLLSNTQEPLN